MWAEVEVLHLEVAARQEVGVGGFEDCEGVLEADCQGAAVDVVEFLGEVWWGLVNSLG